MIRFTRARATLPLAHAGLFVFALVLFPACEAAGRERERPPAVNQARVDVFVRCADPSSRELVLELEAAELRAESSEPVALDLVRPRLVPSDLARRQPMAGAAVPPGQYTALVLRVHSARLTGPRGDIDLRLVDRTRPENADPLALPGPIECVFPFEGRLGRRDAAALFLEWSVEGSLPGGADCSPAFTLTRERPQASLGLLYVAGGAGGGVAAVERASGEVVATYASGAGPRALALARDRRRLYVVNARDGSLDLVDLQQKKSISILTFGLSANSSDVALLDLRGRLVVAHQDLDRVSIVDTGTFSRVLDLPVGRSPVRIASAPDSDRVYVVESGADAVDVIDLTAGSVVGRMPVESRPSDAAVDRRGREIFVGHSISPNLLAFDAHTLAQRASIFVGGDVSAVLCDRRRDRVYVARARPRELVVVDRELASVLRRIPLSARIEALAQPVDGAMLYGAAPEAGELVVVDLVLGKELTPIQVGGRPLDVLVAD